MDSDLINRAAEERQKIFERYEKGHEQHVDPWENPDFSLYSLTDRFGFIHDQKYSTPPEEKKTLEKKLEVLVHREKKWIKMINKWDSKSTKEKLSKRIYKGIPDKVRNVVWSKLLNLEAVMGERSKKNKYQEMLQLARQHGTEARQIDSDVNRQFRDNIFFRDRYNLKQRQLFNVLVAYSVYNSEVSYCQGMSTLAGILLMYLGEEETFWALNILLTDKKFAMHGLFILGFPKLTRFLAHHDAILAKFLPKLKKHFDQCNLDSILYSLKWFFVVFIERIPFSLCLRVWDIYLLEGERVATAMAYTVLKIHKNKLLKLKDMDSMCHYLQVTLQKDFGYDDDYVIKTFEQCSEDLRKAKMDLPPPAPETEYPQKEFGVFVEPPKNEKIGHRKSDFTEIEKEVTEQVIKTREETATLLAELQSNEEVGLGGSNSQLNTVHIPESEDGGSILGSSKRSLADTSVTSTADLSEMTTKQHEYLDEPPAVGTLEFELDQNFMEDEPGFEKSSPDSMEKSNSTIQIYQKPQAASPNDFRNQKNLSTPTLSKTNQDVIRLYVPPADEMISSIPAQERGDDEISQSSNRSSIIQVEYLSQMETGDPKQNVKTLVSAEGPSKVQPQQFYYYPYPKQTAPQSSSSRRGSMTRKTPSPLLNDLIICDHMKTRRSNGSLDEDNSTTFSKRMTSFEELAKKSESNSMYSQTCVNYSSKTHSVIKSASMHSYNLHRADKHSSSDSEYLEDTKNNPRFTHNAQESNENSIKSYDRFFNSDDELEDDEIKQRATKKSTVTHKKYIFETDADEDDENSSNSPTSKSILNTPINDTMPLLSNYQDPISKLPSASISKQSLLSNSVRQKSKIPRPSNRGSNSNSLRKNSNVSSPDSESESYQLSAYRNNNTAIPAVESIDRSRDKQRVDNKIRIEVKN